MCCMFKMLYRRESRDHCHQLCPQHQKSIGCTLIGEAANMAESFICFGGALLARVGGGACAPCARCHSSPFLQTCSVAFRTSVLFTVEAEIMMAAGFEALLLAAEVEAAHNTSAAFVWMLLGRTAQYAGRWASLVAFRHMCPSTAAARLARGSLSVAGSLG